MHFPKEKCRKFDFCYSGGCMCGAGVAACTGIADTCIGSVFSLEYLHIHEIIFKIFFSFYRESCVCAGNSNTACGSNADTCER